MDQNFCLLVFLPLLLCFGFCPGPCNGGRPLLDVPTVVVRPIPVLSTPTSEMINAGKWFLPVPTKLLPSRPIIPSLPSKPGIPFRPFPVIPSNQVPPSVTPPTGPENPRGQEATPSAPIGKLQAPGGAQFGTTN